MSCKKMHAIATPVLCHMPVVPIHYTPDETWTRIIDDHRRRHQLLGSFLSDIHPDLNRNIKSLVLFDPVKGTEYPYSRNGKLFQEEHAKHAAQGPRAFFRLWTMGPMTYDTSRPMLHLPLSACYFFDDVAYAISRHGSLEALTIMLTIGTIIEFPANLELESLTNLNFVGLNELLHDVTGRPHLVQVQKFLDAAPSLKTLRCADMNFEFVSPELPCTNVTCLQLRGVAISSSNLVVLFEKTFPHLKILDWLGCHVLRSGSEVEQFDFIEYKDDFSTVQSESSKIDAEPLALGDDLALRALVSLKRTLRHLRFESKTYVNIAIVAEYVKELTSLQTLELGATWYYQTPQDMFLYFPEIPDHNVWVRLLPPSLRAFRFNKCQTIPFESHLEHLVRSTRTHLPLLKMVWFDDCEEKLPAEKGHLYKILLGFRMNGVEVVRVYGSLWQSQAVWAVAN